MSLNPEDKPFSESHLDSPEYRKRLMRKLNTLIAVLEVACAKVRRTLAGADPDTDRLNRIHKNLKDTLQVCLRAKKALERCERLPKELPADLTQMARLHRPDPTEGQEDESPKKRNIRMVPLRSSEEQNRFRRMGPIADGEVRAVDLEELCRRLLG